MSLSTVKDPTFISRLFSENLIDSPLPIRAYLGDVIIDAELFSDGVIGIASKQYTDMQQAMAAVNPLAETTSNAWQFWTWYSTEREAWTPLEHLRAKLDSQHTLAEVKTSLTHPLRIDRITIPGLDGSIGLTFCPGKCTEGLYGGTWERDLHIDLSAIEQWQGKVLISLMEEHEFALLGVPDFAAVLKQRENLEWLHLPIKDMHIPDANFEVAWAAIGPKLHNRLSEGDSIVIHCRGGLGRTGLLAARMLVEFGVDPVQAVAAVREARERSIETYSQEHYVLTQAWNN